MDYSKKSRDELLILCRDSGLKGYSKKKKDELIKMLDDSKPKITESSKVDYSKNTKNELVELCKERGIKGYSGKNMDQLIKLLESKTVEKEEVHRVEVVPGTKRIASLFAGCGGLDFGFFQNPAYSHVFVNDFDKDACDSYEKNFTIKPICADIKEVKDIPDCDLLIGGFPCQGFSMANPYRCEEDTRNELYLEILRLLKLKKPSYFLLENVKGLLNMGGYETKEDKTNQTGKVMKVILNDLKECGYKVKFKLFDIKNYDVPQKRQRVIIIGVRNDIDFDPKWPEASDKELTLKDAIGDLPIEYLEYIL